MPSKQRELFIQTNQISDAIIVAVMFWAAHYVREQLAFLYPVQISMVAPFRYYKWLYLIILPALPLLLDINGYYDRSFRGGLGNTLWILIKSVGICALIVIASMYFLKLTGLSRGVIALFAVLSLTGLFLKDLVAQAYLRRHAKTGKFARNTILVGEPDRNREFQDLLIEHPHWNLTVVGQLDPATESLEKLPQMLHTHAVACVIFNVSRTSFSDIERAILACEIEGVEAWLVADFVKTSIARATVDDFHGRPLLVFRTTSDLTWQLLCKRLIDIVGASFGLIVLGLLVMLPTAIIIRLTSPGPVLFRQRRSGLHGRQFTMYKFRSMVDNAEMLRVELETFNEVTGPVFKMKDDPRVTPFGRFIRKTSIDELPQLWNVLVGDMSLVGPRPPIPSEVEKYDPWHRRRLSMKPGLTCLWQISGRSNIGFEQWMKLDLQYIDNWSLWLDLKIIARTFPIVFRGLGAH
jgi:exopolysaccharide biosynthesis polyprenyl glycosylphosphotransferase